MSEQNCEFKPSQQIDIRSEAAEASDTKIKVTDLNIICLEEIFEYLDLENLLNVADSNKRLNKAACFVFRRKHEKETVLFTDLRVNSPQNFGERSIFSNIINILRILRCFGCVTSNLIVFLNRSSQNQVDKICSYINEYCADSLIELKISGTKTNAIIFTDFQKPFVNIESLIFRNCHLGRNVMQFNKWFPKMQHLELNENQMIEEECIEMCIPNLKYLSYCPKRIDHENFAPHFENVIRLNPNLRIFHTRYWSEILLQNVSKYLPQLEELTINDILFKVEWGFVFGQIHFKNLKKFDINFKPNFSEFLSETNFFFDQLEEFHVSGIKYNNLLSFVEKYSTIRKLELRYAFYGSNLLLSKENVLQVAKALPLLSELHLWFSGAFSVNEIIRFLDELGQLKKFHFQLDHQSKVDDLRVRLDRKWKVSIEPAWEKRILLQRAN